FGLGLVFNAITVVTYASAFTIIYCKYRQNSMSNFHVDNSHIERKAMKSLSVLIIVFLFERIEKAQAYMVRMMMSLQPSSKMKTKRVQAFSALTCYSSTFYVCFARSSEYRRIFWSQIVQLFGCCGEKIRI
ncbi:hypothetical protein PMAYCL1PPCAC_12972, partial [Pristionchus mayeri]